MVHVQVPVASCSLLIHVYVHLYSPVIIKPLWQCSGYFYNSILISLISSKHSHAFQRSNSSCYNKFYFLKRRLYDFGHFRTILFPSRREEPKIKPERIFPWIRIHTASNWSLNKCLMFWNTEQKIRVIIVNLLHQT